jgi:TonB family protein
MTGSASYASQILALAVWLTCVGMGATGLTVGWPKLPERKAEPPAVQATLIEAELHQNAPSQAVSIPDQVPTPPAEQPPQPPDLPDLPPLPELPAFVEKVAPVAPQPKMEAKVQKTAPVRETTQRSASSTGTPTVQNLTMGQGEGRQPAPAYPRDALSHRQEGTVYIQLLVGTEGQVLSAEVWQASPWPMLNDAALRTVRGSWHFSPGPVRLYRVPIRFRIQ